MQPPGNPPATLPPWLYSCTGQGQGRWFRHRRGRRTSLKAAAVRLPAWHLGGPWLAGLAHLWVVLLAPLITHIFLDLVLAALLVLARGHGGAGAANDVELQKEGGRESRQVGRSVPRGRASSAPGCRCCWAESCQSASARTHMQGAAQRGRGRRRWPEACAAKPPTATAAAQAPVLYAPPLTSG